MQWTIGIDIGALDRGAVAFARWLKAQSSSYTFDGVHVVVLPGGLAYNSVDPKSAGLVSGAALRSAKEVLAKLKSDRLFSRVEVVDTRFPASRIEEEAQAHGSDGIIVGSTKYFPWSHRTHLGSTARHLLRGLGRPTFVVPPSLRGIGTGPILLATGFGPASEGAVALAKKLSADLGRKLEVVHVRQPHDHLNIYLPPADHETVVTHAAAHEKAAMRQWLDTHGLSSTQTSTLTGASVVTALHRHAQLVEAAMVVVGSRQLSTLERIFESSVGSHLAANAPTPVLVVPQGPQG